MLAVGNYGFGEKSTLIPKIFLVPVGLCGFLLPATRKSLPFIKNPAVPQNHLTRHKKTTIIYKIPTKGAKSK